MNPANFDNIFSAYYKIYRTEATTPSSTDDEYTIGLALANESLNHWANYDGVYWNDLWTTNQLDNASGTQTVSTNTAAYTAPSNLREAGGFVKIKDSSNNTVDTYPIIQSHEVQFKNDDANYAYFREGVNYYSTGTASQSGTTITGSGTTFTSAMTGMEIQFSTGETATVTYVSATSLTASVSQTVASASYKIISRKKTLVLNPAPTSTVNGYDLDYDYYKRPTLYTTGVSVSEIPDPYFIVHRMLYLRFRGSRNPYMNTALRDSENRLAAMKMDNDSGTYANPWKLPSDGSSFGG